MDSIKRTKKGRMVLTETAYRTAEHFGGVVSAHIVKLAINKQLESKLYSREPLTEKQVRSALDRACQFTGGLSKKRGASGVYIFTNCDRKLGGVGNTK